MSLIARRLTVDEIGRLDTDGFVLAPGLIPEPVVASIARALDEIIYAQRDSAAAIEQQKFWGVPEGLGTIRFTDLVPLLVSSGTSELVDDLKVEATNILGRADIDTRSVHALHKPAEGNSATPWHQDPAYEGGGFRFDSLTFWIPTVSIVRSRSCLEFIPGSHKGRVLREHQPIRGAGTALVSEPDVRESAVAVDAEPGDVVIHKSYVLHRATGNASSLDRTALVVVIGPQPEVVAQ